MRAAGALAALVCLALAACGGGASGGPTAPSEPPTYSATSPASGTLAEPDGGLPPSADYRVLRRWAAAMRDGDVARAARLFALPSIARAAPGGPIVEVRTRDRARAFNQALRCGARLVGTEPMRGQAEPGLIVGVLRLTHRAGARCARAGKTARVGISIDHGRITRWLRLADFRLG